MDYAPVIDPVEKSRQILNHLKNKQTCASLQCVTESVSSDSDSKPAPQTPTAWTSKR